MSIHRRVVSLHKEGNREGFWTEERGLNAPSPTHDIRAMVA